MQASEKNIAVKRLRGMLWVVSLGIILAGCATTPSNAPQKWDPAKRAEAHVQLAMDYLRRGQFDVASDELDLALSIDPNSDRAHHGKGLLLAQTGYPDEAKKMLAKAAKLNGSNYVAVNDYGIYLCQNGEIEAGIDILQQAELSPENKMLSTTQLGLGRCFYESKQFAQSKKYLRQVLQVSPTLPQALEPMAQLSYQEQNFLSARAFVERYLATGSVTEDILVIGANAELEMGDKDRAILFLSELRRRYPNSEMIATFEQKLESQ